MEIIDSHLFTFLIGSFSTAAALVFVEKWKANSKAKDRIILLEEEQKYLKELLEKTVNTTESIKDNIQNLSKQITRNSTLIDSGNEPIKSVV